MGLSGAGSVLPQRLLGVKKQNGNCSRVVAVLSTVVSENNLSANLGAHENNVGDAEADGDQAEDGRDMRPDQDQALIERERRRQDAFSLTLQSHAEDARRRVEQDADAFVEQRARRDAADDILNVSTARKRFRGGGVGNDQSGDPRADDSDE